MNVPWSDPFTRFAAIYEQAKVAQPKDPNAMTLATVDERGRPTLRVVLLKDFDEQGFVFYTNHTSRKGRDALATKVAALNFYWPSLDTQVRIEGPVKAVSDAEADVYFATRPRESQLGAWASLQSQPLPSREALELRLADLTKSYEGKAVPRPPHWSGFRVAPERIEFWRAHPFRLHWRDVYERQDSGWKKGMLYP
ncbi:MAG: pyridoxamine 5'-phosphate oxidase [Myxococcaceae bacterium]|nr:pyridoxamine 5'-phosphate oxidase [Myxococcaceae bacterium]